MLNNSSINSKLILITLQINIYSNWPSQKKGIILYHNTCDSNNAIALGGYKGAAFISIKEITVIVGAQQMMHIVQKYTEVFFRLLYNEYLFITKALWSFWNLLYYSEVIQKLYQASEKPLNYSGDVHCS